MTEKQEANIIWKKREEEEGKNSASSMMDDYAIMEIKSIALF